MNLLELLMVITIGTLIGAQNFANTGLEQSKARVLGSQANLNVVGQKTQQFCDDTQRACTGLVNGAVTLPVNYLPTVPTDPTAVGGATNYAYAFNVRADGSKCFSIEGTGAVIEHDALLTIPQGDGTYAQPNVAAAGGFLHYDSRVGKVYWTANAASPIAGGC
jgi:hypothetical protein